MKRTKQCPKCQSRNVGSIATSSPFVIPRGPADDLRSHRVASEAWLCTACGYTELYATELGAPDTQRSDSPFPTPDWPRVLDHYYGPIDQGPFR